MIVAEKTIVAYLDERGIEMLPVHFDECARFGLELPELPAWEAAPGHLFPNATAVLFDADRTVDGFAPNAVVLVGKLTRSVDPNELLGYSFGDSRALPGWAESSYDHDLFCGLPSASIGGRYECDRWLLVARTRYIVIHQIIDQYLVQVTVTMSESQRTELAWAVDAFIDGIRVGRS